MFGSFDGAQGSGWVEGGLASVMFTGSVALLHLAEIFGISLRCVPLDEIRQVKNDDEMTIARRSS